MPKPSPELWRLGLVQPLKHLDAFEAALEPFAEALTTFLADPDADENEDEVLWRLEGYSRSGPDRVRIEAALAAVAAAEGLPVPPLDIDRVADTDWVAANLRSFPPILAGRFFVHGSHFEGDVPAAKIGLQIDAGTAFGSGEHATTFGCLTALDGLLKRRHFHRALDLGCGSGILAIALAKAGRPVRITAADIDFRAVQVAAQNARINQVGDAIATFRSTGYASRSLHRRAPYDLVFANILARPLVAMAADLATHLAPGGMAILSGLLVRQERMVLSAHRQNGLVLFHRIRRNGWATLVLKKPGRA